MNWFYFWGFVAGASLFSIGFMSGAWWASRPVELPENVIWLDDYRDPAA